MTLRVHAQVRCARFQSSRTKNCVRPIQAGNTKYKAGFTSLALPIQSGLKAGDGGFQVKVAGNTDLKESVIASTQVAVDANNSTLNNQLCAKFGDCK